MTTRDTQLVPKNLCYYHTITLYYYISYLYDMISFELNFSSEQLNLAARHRNVYYDTVGGDPYGE